jgi:DNA mismatch repair ATPase MutS
MIHACSFVESEAAPEAEAEAETRPLTPITEEAAEEATETESAEAEAPLPPPPPPPVPTVKKTGITKLISQVYAPLKTAAAATVVANNIVLDKQLVITGPNAAGKTTVIKSTLFNIILSQQIGYGFYERAEINPYDYLHCYLNIPDTSGRDSLFQAESRRCMEILRCIMDNPTKRHFCIFDELYSGTNPYEAVAAAYGYIAFISKNPRVDLILTTHYIELCELLEKRNADVITNLHMSVSPDTGAYLYKIASGISSIKGGLKVLRDLDYPTEIVESAREIIQG